MKKVNMKKMVLRVGVVALVLLVLLGVGEAKSNSFCTFKANEQMSGSWEPAHIGTPGRSTDGNIWVNEVVSGNIEWCKPLAYALMPLLPLLVLSLITYKMRDEVFRAWWNFARWWVPVIIVLTFLLNNASGTGGGYLGMGQDFIFLIQGILYTILILGSLWKIIRTHLQLKKAGN